MRGFLMLCLAIASCAVLAKPVEPYEASVVVSGLSYHMDKRQYWENTPTPRDYNEINVGLGIQYNDYRFLVFQNSYYETSIAAMWVPSWELTDSISVAPRLGAALGYGDTPQDMPIMPVVGAEIDWKVGNLHNVLGILGYQTLTYHIQVDF